MNQALENLKAVLCDSTGNLLLTPLMATLENQKVLREAIAELEELLTLPEDINKLIDQGMEIYECLRTAEADPNRVEQIYFETCNALKKLQVHNFILSAKACLVEDGILLGEDGEPYCRFFAAEKIDTSNRLFRTFAMGQKVRRRYDAPGPNDKYAHGEICDCYKLSDVLSEIYSVRWNNGQIEKGFTPESLERDG